MTCPEPIVYRIMKSSLLDRFHARHPELRVESDKYVDLARGDADVALGSGGAYDVLIGRSRRSSVWSVYASKAYLERHGRPTTIADLAQHATVASTGGIARAIAQPSGWGGGCATSHAAARADSGLALVSVAQSGVAVVLLPIALGDAEPDLVRLFELVPELTRVGASWPIPTAPRPGRLGILSR